MVKKAEYLLNEHKSYVKLNLKSKNLIKALVLSLILKKSLKN